MTGPGAGPAATTTLGRCDEMRAEMFLRVEPSGDGSQCAISGTLTGPRRGRDTTLPVTTRLQQTETAGVVRAVLTEPAYWTPDLPNLYRLEAAIESAAAPRCTLDRLVGLRRLGVRGRSLWLDGHRWVPRAARVAGVAGLTACKPAALAALVTEPDEVTLARADEFGVAVLALIAATAADPAAVAARIAAWALHPSAALAILPANIPAATAAEIATTVRPLKDTLLLASEVPGARPPPDFIPPGIDALVVAIDAAATPHDAWRSGASVPLIAWRREPAPPTTGRRPCDTLQAALASWAMNGDRDARPWDWAGYVVT